MRGTLAKRSMSALASRLAGATALACLIAVGAMPQSPLAQEIDLECADIWARRAAQP